MFMPLLNQPAFPPCCLYHYHPFQKVKGSEPIISTGNAASLIHMDQDSPLDFSVPPPPNWIPPEARKMKLSERNITTASQFADGKPLDKHEHNATEAANFARPAKRSSSKTAASTKIKSKITSPKVVSTHPDDSPTVTLETELTRPDEQKAACRNETESTIHVPDKHRCENVPKPALDTIVSKATYSKSNAEQGTNVTNDISRAQVKPKLWAFDNLSSIASETSAGSRQKSCAPTSHEFAASKRGLQSPYIMSGAADGAKAGAAIKDMAVSSTPSAQTNAMPKIASQRLMADSPQTEQKLQSTTSSARVSQMTGARIRPSTRIVATAASITPLPCAHVPDMDDTWTVNLHDVLPTDSVSQGSSSAAKTGYSHQHAVPLSTKTAGASAGSAPGSNYRAPTVETLSSTDSSNARSDGDPLVKIRIRQYKVPGCPGNVGPAVITALPSIPEAASGTAGRIPMPRDRQTTETVDASSSSASTSYQYSKNRPKSSVVRGPSSRGSNESRTSESSYESSSTRIVYFRHIPKSRVLELVSRHMHRNDIR